MHCSGFAPPSVLLLLSPVLPPSFTLRQLSMSRRASTDRLLGDVDINPDIEEYSRSPDINTFDAVLGSPEKRRQIEKGLLWKLDLRLSFLILVSLMNYVSSPCFLIGPFSSFQIDRTNIAWVKWPMCCLQILDTCKVLHDCRDSKRT